MNTVLVTLSNKLYSDSRKRLEESAKKNGIKNIISYDFEEIENCNFYQENKIILSNIKYMGYWLWKPYIIAESLKTLANGDVLLYVDAGIEIVDSLEPLIELCRTAEPVLLFGNAMDVNSHWTKRDAFVLMECDNESYWFSPHCDASVSLYRKCDESAAFVQEWLKYSSNENILTDLPNICGLPNIEGFQDHRYDQSVLSLLAQKFKINLYRAPTQFGNHYKMHDFRVLEEFNCINQAGRVCVQYYNAVPYYNSFYGQLLNHHRTKNNALVDEVNNKDIEPIPSQLKKRKIIVLPSVSVGLNNILHRFGFHVNRIKK